MPYLASLSEARRGCHRPGREATCGVESAGGPRRAVDTSTWRPPGVLSQASDPVTTPNGAVQRASGAARPPRGGSCAQQPVLSYSTPADVVVPSVEIKVRVCHKHAGVSGLVGVLRDADIPDEARQ